MALLACQSDTFVKADISFNYRIDFHTFFWTDVQDPQKVTANDFGDCLIFLYSAPRKSNFDFVQYFGL